MYENSTLYSHFCSFSPANVTTVFYILDAPDLHPEQLLKPWPANDY